MAESVKWGEKGARVNSISPGIIVTPLALDEFNGPRGDFYKNMFAKCPAGRPGTADEVANVAELLMREEKKRLDNMMDMVREQAKTGRETEEIAEEFMDFAEENIRILGTYI